MPSELGADPIAVGRLAVKRGLLAETDLKACVQHLAQLTFDRVKQGDGGPLPTLADVLLGRALITSDQLRELQTDLGTPAQASQVTTRRASTDAEGTEVSQAETTKKQQPVPEQFETTKRQPSPIGAGVNPTAPTIPLPMPSPPRQSAVPKPPTSPASKAIAVGATPSAAARRSFGKYMLVREVGRGGMSVVWEGYDTDLKRRVAIKFLTGVGGRYIDAAQEEILKRFYREAHSAAKLNHPNIVKIYEVGELDGQHYIAMEYIDGETLYDITVKKKIELKEVVRALRDSAHALDHAHRNGILHRDIKPQNIMIDRANHTFIMDFGLARDLKEDERLTLSGIAIGTPNYMPPEHAQGSKNVIDVRSDVYSLGAVLYEMLAGKPPFPGDTPMAVMLAVVNQDPVRPSHIRKTCPHDLENIALKAMEKEKERRYPSAMAMADDLDRWMRGEPVHARRSSLVYRARRLKRYALPVAAAAAAVVIAGSWLVHSQVQLAKRRGIANEHLSRARGLLDRGEVAAAEQAIEAASKLEVASLAEEASALRKRAADLRQAEEERRREAERKAKAREALDEAKRAMVRHEFDAAVAALDRAVDLDASSTAAFLLRGRIHAGQQREDRALADWNRALEIDARFAPALAELGDYWRVKGEPAKARTHLLRALAIDEALVDANHAMGHLEHDEGNLEDADRYFTAALKAQRNSKYYADRANVRSTRY